MGAHLNSSFFRSPHLIHARLIPLAHDEMVKEVLDTMVGLALDGMTMVVVSHEMEFARQVANRMVLIDAGQIVEVNEPAAFFSHPQHERTKLFLSQIIRG